MQGQTCSDKWFELKGLKTKADNARDPYNLLSLIVKASTKNQLIHDDYCVYHNERYCRYTKLSARATACLEPIGSGKDRLTPEQHSDCADEIDQSRFDTRILRLPIALIKALKGCCGPSNCWRGACESLLLRKYQGHCRLTSRKKTLFVENGNCVDEQECDVENAAQTKNHLCSRGAPLPQLQVCFRMLQMSARVVATW